MSVLSEQHRRGRREFIDLAMKTTLATTCVILLAAVVILLPLAVK